MLPYFSWTPSKSFVSFATFESAPPEISMNASRRFFGSFIPRNSFRTSFNFSSSGKPSSDRKPLAPPPLANAEKSKPIALATPASSMASRLPLGINPNRSRSEGTSSKSSETKCEMNCKIDADNSLDTGVTNPQSKMTNFPSFCLNKFPGCGSACKKPKSSNIDKYAVNATAHNFGMSPSFDSSNRAPLIHPVVNTFRVVADVYTGAAVTTFAKSCLDSIASRNNCPFLASAK